MIAIELSTGKEFKVVKTRPLSEHEIQLHSQFKNHQKEVQKEFDRQKPIDLAKQFQKSLEILFDNHSENEIEGRECTPYIHFDGQIYSKYNFVQAKFNKIYNDMLEAWYRFIEDQYFSEVTEPNFNNFATNYLTNALQGFEIK